MISIQWLKNVTYLVSRKHTWKNRTAYIFQIMSILEVNVKKKKWQTARNSGGVLLLFKKVILPGLEKQQSANKQFIWIKMKKDFFKLETDIFICCAYIPPRDSNYFVEGDNDLLDILETDIEKYSNFGQIIVIGDLNGRLGKKVESLSYFDSSTDEENFQDIEIPGKNFQDGILNTSGNKLIKS